MKACAVIPAYDAARTVGDVVREALRAWPEQDAVFVVDDGSRDDTARVAREAGARVLVQPRNLGKGAALRAGMAAALREGFDAAITVDADGQHPIHEAVRLIHADPDARALLLGVRDLPREGAPRANQISNRISNFFLSFFSRRALADTQCGLRRYPLPLALELGGRDDGYAFEAEIILRAVAAGVRLVEIPVRVVYPPEGQRVTHFDSVRDPARIVVRVVKTLALTGGLRRAGYDGGTSKVPPNPPGHDGGTSELPQNPPGARVPGVTPPLPRPAGPDGELAHPPGPRPREGGASAGPG